MPRYSARARKLRGEGKSGPPFIKLPRYIKRSAAYYGLSNYARALLIELIDRYNGCNNGMICLGKREIQYELRCGSDTACRAMRELDDSGLARPLTPGAWRGKRATEWRLMWIRCDKTGDLPKTQWPPTPPYTPKPPGRKAEGGPFTNAERQQRYRDRHRNETEVASGSTKGRLEDHRRYSRSAREPQNRNSSIEVMKPRSATGPHIDIYQGYRGAAVTEESPGTEEAEHRPSPEGEAEKTEIQRSDPSPLVADGLSPLVGERHIQG
jgi:hypothetical protein